MEKTFSVSILGCGWLGMPLASAWVADGVHVFGSTTSVEKRSSLESLGIKASVIDLSRLLIDQRDPFWNSPTLVVTVPPRSRSQGKGIYQNQIQCLVDHLQHIPSLQHVVYTSSTSVYPDVPGLVKEDDIKHAAQALNQALVEVEQLFLSLKGKKVSILRLGGLTGGSRMLAKHFAGRTGVMGGDHPVNLVHQEDAVAVMRFVVQEGLTGVFNVCSPVHPLKKDFYTKLCQRFHLPLPTFQEEYQEGKTVDSSKIQEAGYSFLYPDPVDFSYED